MLPGININIFWPLAVPAILAAHFYVFSPFFPVKTFPAGNFLGPGIFWEIWQVVFLVFIFLEAFFICLKNNLISRRRSLLFSLVILAMFFLMNYFPICFEIKQSVRAVFLYAGLIIFGFLAGRRLQSGVVGSLDKNVSSRGIFQVAVFWVGWISFLYSFLKLAGLVSFSSGVERSGVFWAFGPAVFLGSFWAALSEEIIYRHFLISFLRNIKIPAWLAVLVSSGLWALAHLGGEVRPAYWRLVEIIPVGVGLGIIFIQSGFWPVFWVHFWADILLLGLPGLYVQPALIVPFFLVLVFSGYIFVRSKNIIRLSPIFLGVIFLMAPGLSAQSLNFKDFYGQARKNDLKIQEENLILEMARINRDLVSGFKWPRVGFFVSGGRLNLPDFLSQSLKEQLPEFEDLSNARWQLQAGINLNWPLFDSGDYLKEKLAGINLEVQEKLYARAENRFIEENFTGYLELARARQYVKNLAPFQELIEKVRRILEIKYQSNLLPAEKYAGLKGSIVEIQQKILKLNDREKELLGKFRRAGGVAAAFDTSREEFLLAGPPLTWPETPEIIAPASAVIPGAAAQAPGPSRPDWPATQISLESRYFYSGDDPGWNKMTHSLEPGWQALVNVNIEIFDRQTALEKQLRLTQEKINWLRHGQNENGDNDRLNRTPAYYRHITDELVLLKNNLSIDRTNLSRLVALYQNGLSAPEQIPEAVLSFGHALEASLDKSCELLNARAEVLSLTGKIKNWVEADYEIDFKAVNRD